MDDEEAIRQVAHRTLERFGYWVLQARDGAEAMQLYSQHGDDIALVLMDQAMPVMDGHTALTAIRAINPAVKAIVTSGHVPDGTVAKFAALGISSVLSKPCTVEGLLQGIHDLLHPTS